MRKFFLELVIGLSCLSLFSQSPVGRWDTYDDETGEKKSVVEVYEEKGSLFGKIVQIHDVTKASSKCTKCTDERKDALVMGMVIMRDLRKDDEEWSKGEILDPNNGKIYDCKIWMEGVDKLMVRGYVGWFFRTQTWERVK
jgi:uncharacterized protein (DUF2147 family)